MNVHQPDPDAERLPFDDVDDICTACDGSGVETHGNVHRPCGLCGGSGEIRVVRP